MGPKWDLRESGHVKGSLGESLGQNGPLTENGCRKGK